VSDFCNPRLYKKRSSSFLKQFIEGACCYLIWPPAPFSLSTLQLLKIPKSCANRCLKSLRGWSVSSYRPIANESAPKIIINGTISLFLTAICSSLISNRNSFRVLFDKIASVHFTWKIYLCFSIGNGQLREPALCQLYRHTFAPSARKTTLVGRVETSSSQA